MITIREQGALFFEISRRLKRKIECFAIGGTAMMFLGLKEMTKDIDLVFENKKDRNEIMGVLESMEFKKMDSRVLYGKKDNQPELFSRNDERIDLFLLEIISFIFSEESKKRAVNAHEFESNFVIKIADIHDIILMKCATEREKDLEDVFSIIKKEKINWGLLLKEVENQITLGKISIALDLGLFFENLEKYNIFAPKDFMDSLFKILENQAKERRKK